MLDDLDAMRVLDRGAMLDALHGLPEQVRLGAQAGRGLAPRQKGPFRAVLFAGMGGSAMGADLAARWLEARAQVPVGVLRGYEPPAWAGQGTLLVAVSYSGGTEETLACARAARKRGASVLAVTSGGELASWAASEGADVVRVPSGFQPRAALGHLAFTTMAALDRLGLAALDKEAEAVAAHLEGLRQALEPRALGDKNPAKVLARALHRRVAFAYGAGPLEVAARRFATQLNENPKVIAHAAALPEAHHNEVSAWAADPRLKEVVQPVLFEGATAPALRVREQVTKELFQEAGVPAHVVTAQGDSPLARAFHAIYVGDYASAYLAFLLKRDPTPVEAIQALKARLARARGG